MTSDAIPINEINKFRTRLPSFSINILLLKKVTTDKVNKTSGKKAKIKIDKETLYNLESSCGAKKVRSKKDKINANRMKANQ